MIAGIAIYIAIIIGRWQLSGQQTPQAVFDYVTVLFWIAIALSFLLGVSAYIKAYRRESERERKENAIRTICKLIGQGGVLSKRVRRVLANDKNGFDDIVQRNIAWQDEIRECLAKYDESLIDSVFTSPEWEMRDYGLAPHLNILLNSINAYSKQLNDLVLVITMR